LTALKKYKSAAEKNDAFAQLQVGGVYKKGRGVAQDDAEAVRWYKLAAAQVNAFSKLKLGIMYSER
jgi:TPR repeat protein